MNIATLSNGTQLVFDNEGTDHRFDYFNLTEVNGLPCREPDHKRIEDQGMLPAKLTRAWGKAGNVIPFDCDHGIITPAPSKDHGGFTSYMFDGYWYADVSFDQKELAKSAGFFWDGSLRKWLVAA